MARTPKPEVATATGTVQARRKNERERERAARAERSNVVADTLEAQNATAKRLKTKPTDTRTIANA